jgi:amidohydrolase
LDTTLTKANQKLITGLKSVVRDEIVARGDEIIELAKVVGANPEPGFDELETSERAAGCLESLGLDVERNLAITGLRATRQFSPGGPTVAVLGELDSLRVPAHPDANPETGAVHACGHHAQVGQLIGAAIGLSSESLAGHLNGSVAFIATPAEEFIDVGRRLLRHQTGELGFMSGKQEMIRIGTFDDVDMAMMVHTASDGSKGTFSVGGASTAHVVQHVRFTGKAAHAGGAPWDGVNALQAANISMMAINALRETFPADDTIRVHGIITSGGIAVNSIPGEAIYEGRVRGRDNSIVDAMAIRIENCFKAGALAMGGVVEIVSMPGYMALSTDETMDELFAQNVEWFRGGDSVFRRQSLTSMGGSTDMGDLSQVMPVIHPFVSAAIGTAHGADYVIDDYEAAVVAPAVAMAMTVIDLLSNDALAAESIIAESSPPMTRQEYIDAQQARFKVVNYDARPTG